MRFIRGRTVQGVDVRHERDDEDRERWSCSPRAVLLKTQVGPPKEIEMPDVEGP